MTTRAIRKLTKKDELKILKEKLKQADGGGDEEEQDDDDDDVCVQSKNAFDLVNKSNFAGHFASCC